MDDIVRHQMDNVQTAVNLISEEIEVLRKLLKTNEPPSVSLVERTDVKDKLVPVDLSNHDYTWDITRKDKILTCQSLGLALKFDPTTVGKWCMDSKGPPINNTHVTPGLRSVFRKEDVVLWLWKHYRTSKVKPLPNIGTKVYDIKSASKFSGRSTNEIRYALKVVQLSSLHIHNRYRIFSDDLKEWMGCEQVEGSTQQEAAGVQAS